MSADLSSHDELLPATRRGPSKLVALLGYSALIVVAMAVVVALISLGRLLDSRV